MSQPVDARFEKRDGEQWLIPARAALRPDDCGKFDELLIYDDGGDCIVHAEMMDDGKLWIGFYPPHSGDRRVVMWIEARGRKLEVSARED